MARRVWGDGYDEDEMKRTMPSGSPSLPPFTYNVQMQTDGDGKPDDKDKDPMPM